MPECGKWFSATLLFLQPPPFFSFSSSISASSSRTSLNFGLSGAGCTLRTVVAFVNDICYCPFFFHICKTIIQDSRFISIIITQPGLNHGADKRLSTYVPRYSSEESSQIAFLFGKKSNFNNSSVQAGKDKYVSAEWGFHMHQFMLYINFYCYKGLETSYFPLQVIGHCTTCYKQGSVLLM